MSARKKQKLSLKKNTHTKPGDNKTSDKGQGGNTILHLFKKQREKQTVDIGETDAKEPQNKKDGSEGDVVITKIESVGSPSLLQIETESKKRSVSVRRNLSLSKGRKRKSVVTRNTDDNGDDTDEEFRPSKSRYFDKHSSVGDADHHNSPGRYNLRKSKTDPVINLSDSDEDDLTISDTDVKVTHKSLSQKENLVLPVELATDSNSKKEKQSKNKLSLKRSKTESDAHTLSTKLNKKRLQIASDLIDLTIPSSNESSADNLESVKRATAETDEHKRLLADGKSNSEVQGENENDLTENIVSSSNIKRTIKDKESFNERHSNRRISSQEKNNLDEDSDKKIRPPELQTNPKFIAGIRRDDSALQNSQFSANKNDEPKATYSIFKPQTLTKQLKSNMKQSPLDISDNKTATKKRPAKAEKKSVETETKDDNSDSDNDSHSDILGETDEATKETAPLYKVPYYLENFRTILDTVLSDKENSRLFDETDMKYITTFNSLEEAAQKLYIRLFSRRLAWLPMTKINYPGISENIEGLIDKLVDESLLISGDELTDISELLQVMAAPDLKNLAKSFHLNITGATKKQIIQMLIKKSQQSSIGAMFKGGGAISTEKTMVSRAKTYIGKTCRLHDESRAVFTRILMLFSLYNTHLDEETGQGGQSQLFQMLRANIGQVVYPSYTVNKQRSVFKDRDAIIRFEKALMFELEIQTKTVKNKWTEAYEVYQQAKAMGKDICGNKEFLEWDLELPLFLRSYTAGAIYIRIDNQGVEILQRLKKYKEAVELLEELLSQEVYCSEYRGHWYDRLALNLDAHLKSQKKCLEVIKAGLSDPEVRPSRRYLLYQRAEKICTGPNSKFTKRLAEIEPVNITEAPEIRNKSFLKKEADLVMQSPNQDLSLHAHAMRTPLYVDGMVMPDAGPMGMKYQFVLEGGDEGVTLCAVEELALEHYKENGYPEGLHAEGSIISNLFIMFFWDIEFMDIPNVFHSPFQTHPLDMGSTDFYTSRQEQIDERLEWLRTADVESLVSEVGNIWEKHNGTMCSGINWEKFSGPQKLQGLVSCMGGEVIAGILERYIKDPRHTGSGFPDLTLWNTETKKVKISEVKGPGDRLSHKQILWLHHLLELGVDAEVCYVKAVGSKKLKPTARKS